MYLAKAAIDRLHDPLAAARSTAAGLPANERLLQLIEQPLAGWRDHRRQVAPRTYDVLPGCRSSTTDRRRGWPRGHRHPEGGGGGL